MKKFIMIASLMTATASFAEMVAPNRYVCNDEANSKIITFITTSKAGPAQFYINDLTDNVIDQNSIVRKGNDIQIEDTKYTGKLVTIVAKTIPDRGVFTKSLVLPEVRLGNDTREVTFETVLIDADHPTTFFGPFHLTGDLSNLQFTKVSCTANSVSF